MPVVLAAFDACPASLVAFVVISLISWVMRMVAKAKEEQAPPSVRPRRADRERQREEIEAFNREMAQRRGKPDEFLEVVDEDKRRRPRPEKRPPAAQTQGRPQQRPPARPTAPRPAADAPASGRQRPADSLTNRTAAQSRSLGSGVRSHLAEYMEGRIGQSVQQHLSGGVSRSVAEHLGMEGRDSVESDRGEHPVVRMLRDPQGARTAFILTEVLKRPVRRK